MVLKEQNHTTNMLLFMVSVAHYLPGKYIKFNVAISPAKSIFEYKNFPDVYVLCC